MVLFGLVLIGWTVNFSRAEFVCKHCHTIPDSIEPNMQLVAERLQKVRDYVGAPMIINSGYRCLYWNKKIGGVTNSEHTLGYAADIATPSAIFRYRLLQGLVMVNTPRIGVYSSFIHAGWSPYHPQSVLWLGGKFD